MTVQRNLAPPPDDRGRQYDDEVTLLYETFADQTYRCARRGLPHEDAEEIVNFAFLAARIHWERVRTYSAPIGYVMRTACNLRADALSRANGPHQISLDTLSDAPARPPDWSRDDDLHERLHQALAQLSPREEQMTVLYYWTGLPAQQIAAVLGVQPGRRIRTWPAPSRAPWCRGSWRSCGTSSSTSWSTPHRPSTTRCWRRSTSRT